METGDEQVYTYSDWVDLEADKRACNRQMWKALIPWKWNFLRASLISYITVCLGFVIARANPGASIEGSLLWMAGFAILIQAMTIASKYEDVKRDRTLAYHNRKWESQITKIAFVCVSPEGVRTIIPWETIGIDYEDPNTYELRYAGSKMMLYREPLKAAGLEEEFRSRIGKKPLNRDQ